MTDLAEVGVRVPAFLSFFTGNLLLGNWDGFMNNLFYHQDVRGDSLFDIMPWDLDKTSGLQDPNSYRSRQDTDLPPQFGLDGHARVGARPPNPDGIASFSKMLHSHCAFAAEFRATMAASAAWSRPRQPPAPPRPVNGSVRAEWMVAPGSVGLRSRRRWPRTRPRCSPKWW